MGGYRVQPPAGTGTLGAMDPRRIASFGALLGGLVWLAEAVVIWTAGEDRADSGLAWALFLAGLVVLCVALAAAGYTLVEKAPVWLRAVVAVATPLLVLMVWQLVDQAVGDAVSAVVGGVIALGLGAWGLRRRSGSSAPPPEPPPVRGRRAAR